MKPGALKGGNPPHNKIEIGPWNSASGLHWLQSCSFAAIDCARD